MDIQQKFIEFPHSKDIAVTLHIVDVSAPCIIVLAAIGVTISKYKMLITGLNAQGFNTIAADYPGYGNNQPLVSRQFNYGYADLLVHFIPSLIKVTQTVNTRTPIIFGHSLGGHLATLYAQDHCIQVVAIATGNIGLQYWNFKSKLKILQAIAAFSVLIQIYGYLPGKKVGFGNKEAKTLIQDWCKIALTGKFDHIQPNLTASSQPALFIQMKKDHWAPMSSLLGLSQYFTCPEIEQLDLTTIIAGNQHSVWLKQPDQVISLVTKWLHQK